MLVRRAARIFLVVALALFVAPLLAIDKDRLQFGVALAPGDPAPRLTSVRDFDGQPSRHEYEQHALTIVNFWATWCAPCRQEMPALQALLDKHTGNGLSVFGILMFDEVAADQARAFLKDLGVTYPQGRGHIEVSTRWGGVGIFPTSFLVDRKGKIVRRYVGGAAETIQGMVRDVEDLLAGRPLQNMILPPPPDEPPPTPEP